MREYRYSGYVMQRNGGQETHIKEKMRNAAIAMRQV